MDASWKIEPVFSETNLAEQMHGGPPVQRQRFELEIVEDHIADGDDIGPPHLRKAQTMSPGWDSHALGLVHGTTIEVLTMHSASISESAS